MIGLLQGAIFYKNENSVIIMVNGVGYRVEAVSEILSKNEGDEVLVYIYTHVREDTLKLFGFSSEEELKVFEMLLGVSGIGPKGAISIVSVMGVDGIYRAVQAEDPKQFKAVSGIGSKNAEKIILELKGKVKKDKPIASGISAYGNMKELESALLSLGYSMAEIKNVESNIQFSSNTSEMVKDALKLLTRI